MGEPHRTDGSNGDRTVEYWTLADGLVRVDLLNEEGGLRGSLLRAAQERP